LSQGPRNSEVVRQRAIHEAFYCFWRKEYGGIWVDQTNRLKELPENTKVRGAVSGLTLT
jgi:hypothetical protein